MAQFRIPQKVESEALGVRILSGVDLVSKMLRKWGSGTTWGPRQGIPQDRLLLVFGLQCTWLRNTRESCHRHEKLWARWETAMASG